MIETKEETCLISFVMLDDLRHIDPPICKRIPKTKEAIAKFVMEISHSYKRPFPDRSRTKYDSLGRAIRDEAKEKARAEWDVKQAGKKHDPSYYFSGVICEYYEEEAFEEHHAENVAERLLKNGYFVANRVEKYYVIAFALDGTRFYVYSKDYDPEIINWQVEGEGERSSPKSSEPIKQEEIPEGPIKGPVLTEEDNINPVIATLTALGVT